MIFFKYPVLTSLHCNDIPNKPQRISNPNKCKSQYDFSNTEPIQFEQNNPNIPLKIYTNKFWQIYSSINNSYNKANCSYINNRYAWIKQHPNELNELLKSFNQMKFKKYISNKRTLG